MIEWLGEEGHQMEQAFERVFRRSGATFGSESLQWGGLYDGEEGVQWHIGLNPRGPERWIGVNLEGLKYDGWPLARLITRELAKPSLPAVVESYPRLGPVRLIMERDFWNPRVRSHVELLADVALQELTLGMWKGVLSKARESLASRNGGRAAVTYRAGDGAEKVAEVTPHLMFRHRVRDVSSWERFIREGMDLLDPLYEWTCDRAARQ